SILNECRESHNGCAPSHDSGLLLAGNRARLRAGGWVQPPAWSLRDWRVADEGLWVSWMPLRRVDPDDAAPSSKQHGEEPGGKRTCPRTRHGPAAHASEHRTARYR